MSLKKLKVFGEKSDLPCIDIVYHFATMIDLNIINNNLAQAIEMNITIRTKVLDAGIEEELSN